MESEIERKLLKSFDAKIKAKREAELREVAESKRERCENCGDPIDGPAQPVQDPWDQEATLHCCDPCARDLCGMRSEEQETRSDYEREAI